MKEQIEKLQVLIAALEKEIKRLPKNKLRCTKNRNHYQYYVDGKYVAKENEKLIHDLCCREYYEKLHRLATKILKNRIEYDSLIGSYENYPLDQVFDSLCEGRKDFLRESLYVPVSIKIERFMMEDYTTLGFGDNNENYYFTNKGERVRSKSEKIIADCLAHKDIPYRYEKPLVLWEHNRQIVVYPDFTIMNRRNGNLYYLEHLGMMDDLEYVKKANKKLSLYEKNGHLLGKDLFTLREMRDLPLNINILDRYVEEFFL